ncbi:unnamed protein product [Paramecium pentaurelia]|uniref:Chaperone DnaJ C-terminal domain-containing protein n=1 Tax=Paramecium pentaurelia TaxID=43138 RepID=A0A8S1WHE8_9CILI|nr:unnamed protein product [Paramecium pentaurelia]
MKKCLGSLVNYFNKNMVKRKHIIHKKKGYDIKLDLKLSFKNFVIGGKHQLYYGRQKICKTCKGSRCVPGKQAQKGFSCCGSGWLFYIERESSFEVICNNCDGWEKVVRDPYYIYQGSGIVKKEYDIEIELTKGIQNGTIIRQIRYGHASQYSGEPRDFLIEVEDEVEEDNTLRRDGNNIISELDLSVSEMLLGYFYSLNIITLNKVINTILWDLIWVIAMEEGRPFRNSELGDSIATE